MFYFVYYYYRIHHSEGHSYNILTHVIENENNLLQAELNQTRSLNRILKTINLETEHKNEEEIKKTIDNQRHLNRISYNRWDNEIQRGFDIINTSEKFTHIPYVKKPLSVWDQTLLTGSAVGLLQAPTIETRQQQQSISRPETQLHSSNSITSRNNDPKRLKPSIIAENENFPISSFRESLSKVNTNRVVKTGYSIPTLNMMNAVDAQPVTYIEPVNAPSNQTISITPVVRTGGLSSY